MKEIALIGDLSFNGLISEQPEKNCDRFSIVSSLLMKKNMVFANLEMPVNNGYIVNENKNFTHYAGPEVTRSLLQMLNIGCVSLANNHIYDYKMDGLKATIQILDDMGIYHTGAGWCQEQCNPVIIESENLRIGFLAYVDLKTNPKTELFDDLYINYLDLEKVCSDIGTLKEKEKVDKIICSVHWGRDYSNYYSEDQQTTARAIVDSGADIIMGHHPHTLQGFEKYRDKLIFYSLGQLCFGDFIWEGQLRALNRKTKTGIIIELDERLNIKSYIQTQEKIGNFIHFGEKDMRKELDQFNTITNKSFNNVCLYFAIRIKEAIVDRIYNYFMGYYRKPFFRILSWKNIRKLNYLGRDYKSLMR